MAQKQKKETGLSTSEPSSLSAQIDAESSKRKLLAKYVSDNMVSGTDFYTLRIGGRETKPSLSKPGSEKVLSLFHWRAEFSKDGETWEMMGSTPGILCYVCRLFTIKGNVLVGEGRGARDVKKDGGDVNKAIKMAEKSAQIDAVLRTGGLSDLFTQDVEDMPDAKPALTRKEDRGPDREVTIEMGEPEPRQDVQMPDPRYPTSRRGASEDDEPFHDIPPDVPGQKVLIVTLLKKLGADTSSKEEIERAVAEKTELALVEANFPKIITKLDSLI